MVENMIRRNYRTGRVAEAGGWGALTSTAMPKPEVVIPEGEPPADLVIDDLIAGEGDPAAAGQEVSVHYVGVAWSTGRQFDASWDRNETFEFRLGAGQVIGGWDRGVAGMRPGGRRRLTIPPELGYGQAGAGGVIKGGETLVFVVDLVYTR
jgi:peptidylprolyl isomerase